MPAIHEGPLSSAACAAESPSAVTRHSRPCAVWPALSSAVCWSNADCSCERSVDSPAVFSSTNPMSFAASTSCVRASSPVLASAPTIRASCSSCSVTLLGTAAVRSSSRRRPGPVTISARTDCGPAADSTSVRNPASSAPAACTSAGICASPATIPVFAVASFTPSGATATSAITRPTATTGAAALRSAVVPTAARPSTEIQYTASPEPVQRVTASPPMLSSCSFDAPTAVSKPTPPSTACSTVKCTRPVISPSAASSTIGSSRKPTSRLAGRPPNPRS